VLAQGFEFDGRRVPLLGPEGIFKPAILPSIPLSITTAPPNDRKPRPYDVAGSPPILSLAELSALGST